MNTEEIKQKLVAFWDSHFAGGQAMTITKSDIVLDTPLDECLQILGDSCHSILDIACGSGLSLIEVMLIGKQVKKGLGFDTSKNAIATANEITSLSKIANLEFAVGDEDYLSSIKANSFDGVFCSNFLDVIPDAIALRAIADIKRILQPGGLLLLKFNFLLSADLIQRLKMEELGANCYAMNGVFRANNKTTEEWLKFFPGYEVVKITGFQRAPTLPEDRLVLLKKPK